MSQTSASMTKRNLKESLEAEAEHLKSLLKTTQMEKQVLQQEMH